MSQTTASKTSPNENVTLSEAIGFFIGIMAIPAPIILVLTGIVTFNISSIVAVGWTDYWNERGIVSTSLKGAGFLWNFSDRSITTEVKKFTTATTLAEDAHDLMDAGAETKAQQLLEKSLSIHKTIHIETIRYVNPGLAELITLRVQIYDRLIDGIDQNALDELYAEEAFLYQKAQNGWTSNGREILSLSNSK